MNSDQQICSSSANKRLCHIYRIRSHLEMMALLALWELKHQPGKTCQVVMAASHQVKSKSYETTTKCYHYIYNHTQAINVSKRYGNIVVTRDATSLSLSPESSALYPRNSRISSS